MEEPNRKDAPKEATPVDRGVESDAKRFRWMLEGNGYFMEEEFLCGCEPTSDQDKDRARKMIDEAMEVISGTCGHIYHSSDNGGSCPYCVEDPGEEAPAGEEGWKEGYEAWPYV